MVHRFLAVIGLLAAPLAALAADPKAPDTVKALWTDFDPRKLNDPTWQGKPGQRLTFEVTAEKPNELAVVLTENVLRSYRGKQRQATAMVKLTGGKEPQTESLPLKDFGDGPATWQTFDLLCLRAYVEADGNVLGSKTWAGSQPQFRNLRWEGGNR